MNDTNDHQMRVVEDGSRARGEYARGHPRSPDDRARSARSRQRSSLARVDHRGIAGADTAGERKVRTRVSRARRPSPEGRWIWQVSTR
jgi:hypothetical protein